MAKHRNRVETAAALIILAAGALLAVVVGLPLYMSATATPLHPQPEGAPSVPHADPPARWSGAVDRARHVMRAGLSEQNLPGLSVAVGIGGDVVWAEGFGWRDIETLAPVTPATRFRIGTASSVLTSAAVGVLLEKDQLRLDDEIQAYVPQFPKKRWPVTVRQLMADVAGVASDSGDEGPLFSQRCERPIEALPHFADGALLFEPGTQHRQSNYGWIVISAAVEAAANQPFLTFMHDQVFKPLAMNDTGAESATVENPEHGGEPEEDAPFLTLFHDVIVRPLGIGGPKPKLAMANMPDAATFYFPRYAADPHYGLHLMRPLNLSCYAGSMAFFSTPSDLVRFGLAMNTGTLLPSATVRLLRTSQPLASGKETGFGLGWQLSTVALSGRPTDAAGRDGESLGGKVATLMTFPQRGIVVAVISNTSYADTSSLARSIAAAFDQNAAP